MKKILALILSLAMVLVVLAGCGAQNNEPSENTAEKTVTNQAPTTAPEETTAEPAGDGLKTGLAVISSIAKSKDAGEKDGLAEVNSTVVAVTVDKDGKIAECKIDVAQTRINFSTAGKVTTALDTVYKSKQDLKEDYGMKKASGIQKEWYEQANAFAEYVKGKTVDEVKGIALNEEGKPTAAELTASVTVHVNEFVDAIEKAVGNAKDIGAKAGDKLGLGIVTTIAKSADATADKDGVAQAYSSYTATTFGADGKITSSIIDASQTNVNFTTAGKLTTDLKSEFKTKNELGADYGMVKASSIKKEWFEQADALAKYVVGKTIDEVKGIAVNAEGVPTAAELTSSVTIHITDYITIIDKAAANAK